MGCFRFFVEIVFVDVLRSFDEIVKTAPPETVKGLFSVLDVRKHFSPSFRNRWIFFGVK